MGKGKLTAYSIFRFGGLKRAGGLRRTENAIYIPVLIL